MLQLENSLEALKFTEYGRLKSKEEFSLKFSDR